MKTKNLSKWLILLLCACVVTFYSCDKVDYDQKDPKEMKKQEEKKKQEEEKKKQEEAEARRKKEEEEKKKQLTLDPTSLTLRSDEIKDVKIKNGTAPYKATVANSKIAGVRVNEEENKIVVTGLKEGTTEIVVIDKNMKTGTVKVTTHNPQPIRVSKANVILSVGKSERVNIQSGRFPYKAEAVDKSVVEVSVTDATITIKALKEGKTDVNVTDKVGAKGRIAVMVSK